MFKFHIVPALVISLIAPAFLLPYRPVSQPLTSAVSYAASNDTVHIDVSGFGIDPSRMDPDTLSFLSSFFKHNPVAVDTTLLQKALFALRDEDVRYARLIAKIRPSSDTDDGGQHSYCLTKESAVAADFLTELYGDNEIEGKLIEMIRSAGITDGMPQMEAAKRLCTLTMTSLTYHVDPVPMKDALSTGLGQCHHFAKLYMYLCRSCGIECSYVSGYIDGISHAWNKVTIDGVSYYVDTTQNLTQRTMRYFMISPEEYLDSFGSVVIDQRPGM